MGTLAKHGVHVLALMVLDTTDSAIIRLVVDDPDRARELLVEESFPFTESNLVVVEVNSTELGKLMAALLEAELNIVLSALAKLFGEGRGGARVEWIRGES